MDQQHLNELRSRLREVAAHQNVDWNAVERDYTISWVLAGIHQIPDLRDTLVFKGGTALRKCYFGDYRFSEDLDFSARRDSPRAVTASTNRTKGAAEPTQWLPPDPDVWCWYATAWVAVKARWDLTIDPPEAHTLHQLLTQECAPSP